MYNGQKTPYKSSYDFVPIGKRIRYENSGAEYSGYIDLEIILCSCVHIGSGYKDFSDNGKLLISETIKSEGKPVIPGSSFKGVIRSIASAVSNSCSPSSQKCRTDDRCIVCDMFGMMGRGSKVIFPDFKSDNAKTRIVELNKQFPAKKEEKSYYKFYATGENNYEMPDKIKVEVITSDSTFSGRIFFKKLSEEQLSLLMLSLGLNDNKEELINLKIGGYKNEGIGEVYTKAGSFKCDKINKTPSQLAGMYKSMKSVNKKALTELQNILMG